MTNSIASSSLTKRSDFLCPFCNCLQVMAYPVVGVLWGMARFKEFKQGSKTSLALIAAQVAAYSTAVALLASSAELRSSSSHH
jgi:hypothetical protein